MTPDDVNEFERVKARLTALHAELSILSKGKPDNPLNKFKLGIVNGIVVAANALLDSEFRPMAEFVGFDDGALPTNSDVAVVLSQYIDAMEGWRCAHVHFDGLRWIWNVEEESIKTESPSRYRRQKDVRGR
jgi:hypothetical protein